VRHNEAKKGIHLPLTPTATSYAFCEPSFVSVSSSPVKSLPQVSFLPLNKRNGPSTAGKLNIAEEHPFGQLAKGLGLLRSRVEAFNFGLGKGMRQRDSGIYDCSDLSRRQLQYAGKAIANFKVWLAAFRGALKGQSFQRSHLRRANIDAVSFGVAGNDDTDHGLAHGRHILLCI
jgi:hypothetical protein